MKPLIQNNTSASMEARGKVKKGRKKILQVWRKKEPPQPQPSRKIMNSLKMEGKEKKGRKNANQVWRKKQPPSPSPPWVDLPFDVTANILNRLSMIQILLIGERVCTTWRNVYRDPSFWRMNYMRDEADISDSDMECRNVQAPPSRVTSAGLVNFQRSDINRIFWGTSMSGNFDIY